MGKRRNNQTEIVLNERVVDVSPLHHFIHLIEQSLGSASNPPARIEMEKWAMLIGEVMSARWRHYHVPEHVFKMCEGTVDRLEVLSILFHDLVFLQVDRRIHPKLKKYLYDFSPSDVYEVTLHGPVGTKEYSVLPIVYSIFRVQSGQKMSPSTGLNELLSAVVALRILKPYLSTWELMQIAGCIEATIPFRGGVQKEKSIQEKLALAYSSLMKEYSLDLTAESVDEGILRSVHVANLDIRGFSSQSSSSFLSDTWNLLLEGNPVFKNPFYFIGHYLSALEKVERFYAHLDPASIPSRYQNQPNEIQFAKLVQDAKINIEIGKMYLQAKILANSILQAIAHLTGGDAPVVLFLGNIHSSEEVPVKIDQYLDRKLPEVDHSLLNSEVLQLLSAGRAGSSSFDLRNSPLSTYIYTRLSRETYLEALENQRAFSIGKMSDLQFLKTLPIELISAVLSALAQVALTRTDAILDLKKTLRLSIKSMKDLKQAA